MMYVYAAAFRESEIKNYRQSCLALRPFNTFSALWSAG